jgi:hypothetical protein
MLPKSSICFPSSFSQFKTRDKQYILPPMGAML